LILNAGVGIDAGRYDQLDIEAYKKLFDINVCSRSWHSRRCEIHASRRLDCCDSFSCGSVCGFKCCLFIFEN